MTDDATDPILLLQPLEDEIIDPRSLDDIATVLSAVTSNVQHLASQVRELRRERRLDHGLGTCDVCEAAYPLESREGRCGDCGMCAAHCRHFGRQVVNRLTGTQSGWEIGWEWPGILTVRLDKDHELCTGLNGWTYGTVNVLDHGAWESTNDAVDIPVALGQETDVNAVADAIEAAVLAWRRERRG